MCGIFGIVRRTFRIGATAGSNTEMKNLFKQLLVKSQVRGMDSSGFFLSNKEYTTSTWVKGKSVKSIDSYPLVALNKSPISADKYVESKEYLDTIEKVNDWTVSLVGHTRMATQGLSEDNRNNHPFLCGNILGVHNGVITNWRKVAKTFDLKLKGNCDSEVIFALIQQFMEKRQANLQEAISATSRQLDGGMACAVMDITNLESLTLFRRGRPLRLRFNSSSPETILFSSEDKILQDTYFEVNKKAEGLKVLDWKEVKFKDNSGVTLDTRVSPTNWVKESTLFKLS